MAPASSTSNGFGTLLVPQSTLHSAAFAVHIQLSGRIVTGCPTILGGPLSCVRGAVLESAEFILFLVDVISFDVGSLDLDLSLFTTQLTHTFRVQAIDVKDALLRLCEAHVRRVQQTFSLESAA